LAQLDSISYKLRLIHAVKVRVATHYVHATLAVSRRPDTCERVGAARQRDDPRWREAEVTISKQTGTEGVQSATMRIPHIVGGPGRRPAVAGGQVRRAMASGIEWLRPPRHLRTQRPRRTLLRAACNV